jgi:hypothetical protein
VLLIPHGVFKKKLVSVGLTADVEAIAPGAATPAGTVTFHDEEEDRGYARAERPPGDAYV